MIRKELLRDSTESYLKALIADASGSLSPDFDSFAPFGELGIDSFRVLKVLRKLEADFGTLPKSLLFENFTINDLANYFVDKHEPTLSVKFADRLQRIHSDAPAGDRQIVALEVAEDGKPPAQVLAHPAIREAEPIRMLEKDAYEHPEYGELIRRLFARYKVEACVSRGTRKIAPNLFIGSSRRGYFNYGRSKNIILVYGFTGPRDYLPELLVEMYRHCETNDFQLNVLAGDELPPVGGQSFSATPFGVMQRILNLGEFRLDGGAMRRLRYQVTKFEKAGICRTDEYRCGSNPETDRDIVRVIDRWSEARTMVNPLVRDVRGEILAGALPSQHRLFLTYLNDILQAVIMITGMSVEENGYLMDLEFYPPDMSMGGLEFAIVQIIKTLVGEGCIVLSMGGTYGCKLGPSPTADPAIDKILDDLREQNIFNDQGNLQFKNKFRPEDRSIFLCRPVGSGDPENVIDIIMMIADPEKMQTSDEENHNFRAAPALPSPEPVRSGDEQPAGEGSLIEGNDRSRTLAEFGFNPLNIPYDRVEFDLKTDSWSQLEMPAIAAQMKHLHAQLQQPLGVDDVLKAVFPFDNFVLTASGQAAEHVFFKAWLKKGVVLQNLLFPSTIFHQIDKGFSPKELPHAELFRLDSQELYKGNLDWDALQAEVAQDRDAIAFVCIEVSDNAAGGAPVSWQHLRDVKALLAGRSIPLVIDATRVMENAQFLIEHEKEHAGKSVWTVAREILSGADAVIGSLTKDFCVNKGGIVATNDVGLFARLQELVQEDGGGIDLIDRRMIALSLQSLKQIEANVLRRMEGVRRIWASLNEHHIPVVQPAGGHCILIDVKQIREFRDFKEPVASFLAWLYLNTGIRAGAHSVGMQKHTPMNGVVRLAIPVGVKRAHIEDVIDRLVHLFDKKVNIPEVVLESSPAQPMSAFHANYRLIKYHNASGTIIAAAPFSSVAAEESAPATPPVASLPASSPQPAQEAYSVRPVASADVSKETERPATAVKPVSRRAPDVAIVGMAGRYPKAKNLKEFWDNLAHGLDCVEELPADRYERRLQYGSARKYRGGFIEDVDKFDSLFFNISPREAEWQDPQERLFLEVAWEAMEDAGYYPEILAQEDGSRNIGVFVGAVWAMYQMLGVEEKRAGGPEKVAPNSFLWSIANRVSFCLNLSGPSLTLDTACSSSLTALYLAHEAIQAGECSAAIVGGVNLDLHQTKFDINSNGGALSPDGVCRAFGKGANGYVAGEGIGALVLKPLDEAIRNGDNIYGVIKSAAVNHGGRTSGYTVPNPRAQGDLIATALQKANIDARSIGYVEAHGTGTELGDPLEITGLNNAFKSYAVGNQTCAIGSVKSNIGHLEAAAGVVGVSKVLLQMRHRQLAPSLHSGALNEFIDFEHSPFYVVQKLEEWKAREIGGAPVPLRAGISSFGAGGANAHIILESYEPLRQGSDAPIKALPLIFPLSARNEDQLREAAVRLAKFLQPNGAGLPADLKDVAFTLQQGRKSFEHRAAVIATTQEELIGKLTGFIEGERHQDVVTGHAKGADGIMRLLNRHEKQEFVRLVSQGQDPHKIAGLWTEGLLADWQGFQSPMPGRRVSLPTYPFADKRHWAADFSPRRRALHPGAGIHPLLDSNESTFERQLFRKTFHDRDFFIYDHHVSDIPTLPGVAYLELARKAGEIAAGRKVRKIRNILWVSPIAVLNGVPKEVFIELKPRGDSVPFEVFSEGPAGKILHSQGKLLYETREEAEAAAESIDLAAVRSRCAKVTDGTKTYPLFKSFGLNLGPSFQVLQDVYKNELEILGALKLPEFRKGDLDSMALPPSLMDGSLQAGMGAQLTEQMSEMFVPYSIGEVEILHPLQPNCFSYITPVKGNPSSRVLKSNVVIVDETGKVLVKIRESVGVPLREVHEKPAHVADADGFTNLYYSYDWEKAPLAAAAEQSSAQSFVLFATDDALSANADQILVRPGNTYENLGGQTYTVNPQNKDDFAQLFESLIAKGCAVENVVFAWPLGHTGFQESLELGVYSFLFVTQALIKHKREGKTQLLYLYSQSADGAQPHNEAVGGFVNALRLEHPKMVCKMLEVRLKSAGTGAWHGQIREALSAELSTRVQDANAIRYEGLERCIRKLRAFPLENIADAAPVMREQGVVLITGGAGGLGLIFAEFLAKNYKARLVLTGRSSLSAESEARLDELRNLGAEVVYLLADVSREEEVRGLVGECKARFGQINGIIHAAGVLRDSFLRNKTSGEMSAVLAPKVYGTLHLDELTRDEDLDFFVTFSSLAAVAGNAGQCDYSFANSFMDSFVAGRERLRAGGARSGKTLSLNWSIWAGGGMKLDEQTELFFRETLGIRPLSVATGIDAFVRGLASGRSHFAVLEGVQDKVEVAWGLRKRTPSPAAPASATVPVAAVADRDLAERLQNDLTQIVMTFLKLDAGDVSSDAILLDLGFDSMGLTTFANAVNEKFQLDITPVLFFDYASLGEIAKYLAAERKDELLRVYGASTTAPPAATPYPPAQQPVAAGHYDRGIENRKGWDPSIADRENAFPAVSGGSFSPELRFINKPIAIVGMSGVMPQSDDLDEFWENLKNSTDMITVIPPDRWRWEDIYGDPFKETNKSNSKWGGFMREVDKFDPLFFGISPREAQMMDPQQRIFLEQVWKAVEDSGQRVSDLAGTKTGVFVGVATTDYAEVINRHGIPLDGYTASGNSHSILANRVSFLLNLHGPSAPIDTACSSSLIALHRAIESIHTGSSDMAIVGGVHVMLSPAAYISFSMAGMLSGDGKCKTFDKQANGYVRGEGCGVIFLKSLAAAEADGNHIYAVIKSTAENHGGKVTTMTAPNSVAQMEVLIEAYEKGQVDPATVGYIECHGTGTPLGDPIEIQGLSKAFSELYKRRDKAPPATPHCGLSSVKTNIGHLETAAGIAGILKALLAIKHKQIPANIHFQEMNPYINLKGTPFYIADGLTPWASPIGEDGSALPRRAGVSSFGFGGANAHVVLEEYVSPKREAVAWEQTSQLIVLSAKNEDQLNAYVQSMRVYLDKEHCELIDLAYTLQVGRDEMPERLAMVVSSTEELRRKFDEILKSGEVQAGTYRGNTRRRETGSQLAEGAEQSFLHALIARKDLSRLAELWASGTKIDWRVLYGSNVPNRISVPTYPFARERHWIPGVEGKTVAVRQDHVSQPLDRVAVKTDPQQAADHPRAAAGEKEVTARLESLVPVWNPVRIETGQQIVLPESTKILLMGADQAHVEWVRKACPSSQFLLLGSTSSVDIIEKKLRDCAFDQLLWIAPDVACDEAGHAGPDDERIIDQQERGVLTVFRVIKALLRSGYASRMLQWTVLTSMTQRVTEGEPVHPAHAAITGLIGSLAKEYPQWDLRLLDVESLTAVTAQECLSLRWDRQGNALAHRRGEWFQQGLTPITVLPHAASLYRQNGVYVVIGGAGGIGEVWSRFMIEHYQANVVWIGRRPYDDAIETRINSLTREGRAPLYLSADATDRDALEQAYQRILNRYPAIHGVVQSAVVLHDQSIARLEESAFRASLSAKVDISVNMDWVFGRQELDFMLFFSSVMAFFKSPFFSSYSAGCTFKDSFAQKLWQERPYPVKVMNWGYWGSVGVAADDSNNKNMALMGIGSIEPAEGMASLQALISSDVPQLALLKKLKSEAEPRLTSADSLPANTSTPRSVLHEQHTQTTAVELGAAENFAGEAESSRHIRRIITEKLSEMLRLDTSRIQRDAPLAEYGVDSIIGVNLVRAINEALEIDLDPMKLFEYSTVDRLTEYIATLWQDSSEVSSDTRRIQCVDLTKFERLPLSFAQERVWFFHQLEPDSAGYNVAVAVVLNGELDIDHLNAAFNLVIARHENLRTLFPSHDGQGQQLILDRLDFKLEHIDLSHDEERDRKAKKICQADAESPFDLARGPLIRGKVIRLAEREHILMLNLHHIICDGWSMGILTRELGLILEAFREGRKPALPPLPIQYVDYSVWQRQWLEEGGILKRQLAYWREKLNGVPASLSLATDYRRPSVQSLYGATHKFILDAQLTRQLKSLAERKGGTLFMSVLAAFKVLLYRYTDQQDICVGTLIANRQHSETEGLIGMFVNTLALRSQVDGDDTVSAFLSQVKATCLEAYENQDTPFEKVVDMLRPRRTGATNPLFQVLVIFQNTAMGGRDPRLPDYPLEGGISKFDLSIEFTETTDGLVGSIEYCTALYKPDTIERMARHFTNLCRAITVSPAAKIADLDFMDRAEKDRLLVDNNATRTDYPKDECVHHLFEKQALHSPERAAVVFGDEHLSYRELYDASRELGLYLQSIAVTPDSLVGLCMERSLDMVVGIMGILRGGGAYLPLDPADTDDRLSYVLHDSQAAVVLTQETFKAKMGSLLAGGAKLLAVDTQREEIGKRVSALAAKGIELRRDVTPHNLSHVLYTASAAGKAKGVLVEHEALVNRIHWMQRCHPLNQDDVVLLNATDGPDVSMWQLFWPLMAGATVVLAVPYRDQDAHYLENLIKTAKVTALHFVPSVLDAFVSNGHGSCGGVKRIFCGGDGMDKQIVDRYKVTFPNASLHHLYGPSDAAIDVTAYDCSLSDYAFVPIGSPIDNTQVYILDHHNRPQPVGVPGELHVAGDALPRGYLNRPELMRKAFVANPFIPGTRMYRTGDRACWLDDGNIQYLGRSTSAN